MTNLSIMHMFPDHVEEHCADIIEQQDLFTDKTAKRKVETLNKVLDNLNDKYGGNTVHRARKINQKTGTFSEESRL